MSDLSREQEAAISRMADVFPSVRVGVPAGDGSVVCEGGSFPWRSAPDVFWPENYVVLDRDGKQVVA